LSYVLSRTLQEKLVLS